MKTLPTNAPLLARGCFAALLLAIFVATNAAVLSTTPLAFNLPGLLYAWLLELSVFALAYDTSQDLLCLVLPKIRLPSLPSLERHPAVALLCVTCDDVDLGVLRRLGRQNYPSLDLFILDDSQLPESRQAIDTLGFQVVRRLSRAGYKAGNLNNWLFTHASRYDYFVVADADSILPEEFVDAMVRVAEHPQNHQVAILESMIYHWNGSAPFARPQAALASFQRCRQARFLSHLDSTLSVGHNNLYRTSALQSLGGFAESYLAEDYATTIVLLQRTPWKCKTAEVKSYERAPANVAEYARRQSRWAYQTFQLCSLSTARLPWVIRLALLRALQHFLLPVLAYVAMLWLICVNSSYWPAAVFNGTLSQQPGSLLDHPAFELWVTWLVAPALLRLVLLTREGVPAQDCLRNTLFHLGLFFTTTWPVIRRLAGFRHPNRRGFEVTGRSPDPGLWDMLKMGAPGIALAWITLLSFIPIPYFLVLNLTWLAPACLSPVLVRKLGGTCSGPQEAQGCSGAQEA